MSREAFISQLIALGYRAEATGADFAVFPYEVQSGKLKGKLLKLGLQIPASFPANAPGGPHVSPHIHPLHPDQRPGHPTGGIHQSEKLGPEWQYWSRPFSGWATSDRSVKSYMTHIRKLFDTQ